MPRHCSDHYQNYRSCLAKGLILLLFFALSCKGSDTDPSKTPPGVSLRIWGTLIQPRGGGPTDFDIVVGADSPLPDLITHVIPSTMKISAIASQPERGLGELRLSINTLNPDETCYESHAWGKLEFRTATKTPIPLSQQIETALPKDPVGVLIIDDYNLYLSYLTRFECEAPFKPAPTVVIRATARNIAGKVSQTPQVTLRFHR